jgi:hypothetical protein
MSRDERSGRMRGRSVALACILSVSGAWLLLARARDAHDAERPLLPGSRLASEAPATLEHARDAQPATPRPNADRVQKHDEPESASLDRHDAPGSDLQHPLTAEHRALYSDSELLDASWRALQARDFNRAREALAQHRAESARTHDDLNDGLTILADCMQYPSAASRERAQRFYDEQTFSMARRRIRRYCLEPAPSAR